MGLTDIETHWQELLTDICTNGGDASVPPDIKIVEIFMKKTELKTGMIIKTEYGYWGVVEIENNQIDFCYRPRISKDKQIATLNEDFDKVQTDFYYRSFCGCESNDYQKVSLNEVFEFDDGKLGIGFTITEEMYKEHSEAFGEDPFFGKAVGDLIITEEFVAVYTLQQIDSF